MKEKNKRGQRAKLSPIDDYSEFRFKNGSIIKSLGTTKNIRGRRANILSFFDEEKQKLVFYDMSNIENESEEIL